MFEVQLRQKRLLRLLIVTAAFALLSTPSTLAETLTIDEQAKTLEAELIAPCCWRQPVAVHESGASHEVRKQIRVLLRQGLSHQQVLDTFVAQYGQRILAAPRATGFNVTAYWIPLLVLAAGIGIVLVFWREHLMPSKTTPRVKKGDEKYLEKLRREIAS